ncbi:hypothetical protein GCM10022254_46250 [Actinomadura meridiana]|uniref:Fluoride-specific ion channel FluC n=1 Tax=Actinomadura meridiana TaxID=559626 RepID=A0ABP8CAP3_9ACTN
MNHSLRGRLHNRELAEAALLHPHKGRPPVLKPRVVVEIAVGGALGALARDLLSDALPGAKSGFPWDTFTVNMLGCLAMGALTAYLLRRRPHPFVRPLMVTGYLGGFTTFSHLIDGIYKLGDDGRVGLSVGYAAASVFGGWIAIAAGLALGRLVPRRPGEDAT